MTGLILDLRAACRRSSRNIGLTLVALTSLSVSIGVSVAITSVASAVLVRPLPYDKPEELVMIWRRSSGPAPLSGFRDPRELNREILTPGMVLAWEEGGLPLADFAVIESWETGSPRVDLIEATGVQRLRGALATANLFDVLGVRAAYGRTFGEDETGVAVISDRLWRSRFGADPSIVGRTVTLELGVTTAAMTRAREQRRIEIIGVLPERFRFDYPQETEIWLPLTWGEIASQFQIGLMYRAVGRLRPGTPARTAEAALQAFRAPLDVERGNRIWLEPMHDYAVGGSRAALLLSSALAVLVLLSGAANAATAFAASTASRLRNLRVRRALGASQGRLARQVFTETAMVAVLAGAVGLVSVALVMPALRALLPATLPRVDEIGVDWPTLAGTGAAVVVTTLLAGLIPAWLSIRDRAGLRIDETSGATLSPAALRLRAGLLAVQFTLVTALLIAGGMLVRSFWNLMEVDRGFQADANVYAMEIRSLHVASHQQRLIWERELLRRVRALNYVEAASTTSAIPFRGVDFVNRVRRFDDQEIPVNVRRVDPAYFDLMRIPLLSGRFLTDDDTPEKGWVAVVSQSLAEKLYPGESPVGRFLEGNSGTRIVGVVADIRARAPSESPMPAYYRPRAFETTSQVWLLIRTRAPLPQVAAEVRQIVQAVYPRQPVERIATLAEVLDDSVSDRRAYAVVAGGLAVTMLLLSALGLCGHLSHVVAERGRDLAIRTALGASGRQQLRVLAGHVVPALLAGVVAASAIVAIAYRLLEPFLFEIPRFDAGVSTVAALLVTIVTAVAVVLPAYLLSRLDAAAVLKAS